MRRKINQKKLFSKEQPASALILVLMVMMVLTFGVSAAYRTALFYTDFSIARLRAEQQYWMTEAVLARGVLYAQKEFNTFLSQPGKTVTLDQGLYRLRDYKSEGLTYRGSITCKSLKNRILVQAFLRDSFGVQLKRVACVISKDTESEKKRFIMTEYAVG